MIKYAIYDAKLGIYWDATSLGKLRYHDSIQSAISDWESDNPPKTLQKQQISFYNIISDDWCVPTFNKQCRFFVHEVEVDSPTYKLLKHNIKECKYEDEERNNKYGRTQEHEALCKKQGIVKNPADINDPFINKLHR